MALERLVSWFQRRPRALRRATQLRLSILEERATPTVNVSPLSAVGSGPGMDATVRVYNAAGTFITQFKPFPTPNNTFFQGGVETAIGDIDGDSVPDVICGAGQGGGPHVKVFSGVDVAAGSTNPAVIRDFFAYQPDFTGGVSVAAGDVNGDGLIDIVTGAGPGGGPHVVAYDNGVASKQLMNFFPYESTFRGGVNVACTDIGGDGVTDEVITGAGITGGPKITVYNFLANPDPTQSQEEIANFFAYDSSLRNGVYVGGGFTTNNRDASNFLYGDIITGGGPSAGPHVKVFRLLDANYDSMGRPRNWTFFNAGNVFAYAQSFTGGVKVGAVRTGSFDDILTGAGQTGGPDFKIFNQTSIPDLTTYVPTQRFNIFPFDAAFLGGINVS